VSYISTVVKSRNFIKWLAFTVINQVQVKTVKIKQKFIM